MPRAVRFLGLLLAGLALLAWLVFLALTGVTRQWLEKDLKLRAQLAVTAAQQGLAAHWTTDKQRLTAILTDITRDERIMGAAACASDGVLLASTEAYPHEFGCRKTLEAMDRESGGAHVAWAMTTALPSGRVQLSATRIEPRGVPLGVLLLVHDLSYVERREATTRNVILGMFFVLAVSASVLTLGLARLAWRRWARELRSAIAGDGSKEFQPLARDVRALVDELARDREAEVRTGAWGPDRLRATLKQHLHGERVVVLANREPYIHERDGAGVRVVHPASGLVTALEPVMRACSGVWVAHGSGGADRDVADSAGHVRVPPGEESYLLRRVWLTPQEEAGYYYGLANEGLWPLCHLAHARPIFRAEDYEQYVAVNRRFADAVCEEADTDDPIVLVQDYHFALAPRMIRERLPRATILSFWHIPWPNAERMGICPWREELLSGLLGSSIIGFHTQQHCNNFIDSVDAFMESRIDREEFAVVQGPRKTLVRAYPISIEWPVRRMATVPTVEECRRSVREELELSDNALLGVGVDRLDYTKGIEERFLAVDALLASHEEFRGRFVFVQIAAPSRTKIERYQRLNDRLETLAEEINARWRSGAYRPIAFLRTHHEPLAVFRHFRAADLCYVSSLHDGMNLVAKEFVAARDDEQGVLVLSQFTGAARELTEALVVNPYDIRQASEALATALRMPPAEQRERMRSMRRIVAEFNVYRWAGRMLIDAAEVRRRERLTGRLSSTISRVLTVGR
ncbi:MAG: trehalose-6-phosphate synthase [Deltaproteobacteria bacterium]|nr:trehalose-6-phosphate synthase [Deltaproteobacteria bacterium]